MLTSHLLVGLRVVSRQFLWLQISVRIVDFLVHWLRPQGRLLLSRCRSPLNHLLLKLQGGLSRECFQVMVRSLARIHEISIGVNILQLSDSPLHF